MWKRNRCGESGLNYFELSGLIAKLTVIKLVSNLGIIYGLAKTKVVEIGAIGFKVCGLVQLEKKRNFL